MVKLTQIENDFGVQLASTNISFHDIYYYGNTIHEAIVNARKTLSKSGGLVFFPKDDIRPSMYWIFQEGSNNRITDNVYFASRHTGYELRPFLDEPFKEGDIIRNTNPDFDFHSSIYHKEKWYRKDYLEMHPRQIPFVSELPEPNEDRLGQLYISNHELYGNCIYVCVKNSDGYVWNFYTPNIIHASQDDYGTVKLDSSVSVLDGRLSNTPPVGATYTQYIDENDLIFKTIQEPSNLFPNTEWKDISRLVVHVSQQEIVRVWRRLS